MGELDIIDARGLSCPQPAMLARQALQKLTEGSLELIVDNSTARENVSRIAKNLGWEISVDERSEDDVHLLIRK
ncbi:MAG: sulfurtransferase TusA family protein [Dehalococcoidales bacterium]|nr:MAG: sulfurtransferase TusA family protein [Dehalococcoidales bacterium]